MTIWKALECGIKWDCIIHRVCASFHIKWSLSWLLCAYFLNYWHVIEQITIDVCFAIIWILDVLLAYITCITSRIFLWISWNPALTLLCYIDTTLLYQFWLSVRSIFRMMLIQVWWTFAYFCLLVCKKNLLFYLFTWVVGLALCFKFQLLLRHILLTCRNFITQDGTVRSSLKACFDLWLSLFLIARTNFNWRCWLIEKLLIKKGCNLPV